MDQSRRAHTGESPLKRKKRKRKREKEKEKKKKRYTTARDQ